MSRRALERRYFEEEMRYLYEAGKAYAQRHEDRAPYLNVDSVRDRDPYVERLFEGFAFLTGRIRERLDDELPEYAEGMFNLLYPHFLKPVPSLAIVGIWPKRGALQEAAVLERGAEVRSKPVGPERAVCRFRTTQRVVLNPIELTDLALAWDAAQSSVRLRFTLDRGAEFAKLDLRALQFFLDADPDTAATMHLFLTRHVRRVEVRAGDDAGARIRLDGQRWVQPAVAGLQPGAEQRFQARDTSPQEDGLLRYGPRSFTGFRLLQEYLCFRRRFMFVDVLGADRLQPGQGVDTFEVEIFFDREYPEAMRFRKENLRLHCTPVVNLFPHDAETIRADGYATEYLIVPSVQYPQSLEVYEVDQVVGLEVRSNRRHTYKPFFEFGHDEGREPSRYYTTRRRRRRPKEVLLDTSLQRRGRRQRLQDVYLALDAAEAEVSSALNTETLSVDLWCTNGSLPNEELSQQPDPGDAGKDQPLLDRFAPDVPGSQGLRVVNLTKPTLILHPPLLVRNPADRTDAASNIDRRASQEDFYWKLLSHLSFNYVSIASPEAFSSLLGLYDWTEDDPNRAERGANRRIRDGLRDVRWEPDERVVGRGAVWRGARVTIEVDEGAFATEGDLCLFGLVLHAFLSMYATMNAFVHLVVRELPSGKTYAFPQSEDAWANAYGAQPLL